MTTFRLSILSADRLFFEGECVSLVVPLVDGQYGVLAGHSNLVAAIVPGILQYKKSSDAEMTSVVVSDGLLKVENDDVLVLVITAEKPEEVDFNKRKREEAEEIEAKMQKKSIQEYRIAHMNISRIIADLKGKSENDDLKRF